MKNLCFLQSLLDLNAPEKQSRFSAFKYKEQLVPEAIGYLSENRAHRELWKGVPIGRDGKVRLRDGRTGEYFDGRSKK